MITIRFATEQDHDFWFSLDRHLPETEYVNKVRNRHAYVLLSDDIPTGLLRYNLFWDNTPFCNMLYIKEPMQNKGFGRMLIKHWENDMKVRGYGMVMTSTQVDETAQHFYRKLGYSDCGGLILNLPGYEQPMEMFLCKLL